MNARDLNVPYLIDKYGVQSGLSLFRDTAKEIYKFAWTIEIQTILTSQC